MSFLQNCTKFAPKYPNEKELAIHIIYTLIAGEYPPRQGAHLHHG